MTRQPEMTFFPSNADIRSMLVGRIDDRAQGVGVVVGVIDAAGARVISHGEMERGTGRPVDGDTLFEIGSATKVFTTLLLAEMVRRGEVALDDPIARYLPAGVTAPTRAGRQITLVDLATHTSGLPPTDPDFRTTDPDHPRALAGQAEALAAYSTERLHAFLSGWELKRDIGVKYVYSNLGLGLLGHILALRVGVEFEALLRERITGPLGLADTVIEPGEHQRSRLASAHDARRQPVADLRLDVLAGAGALRSTANDLLAFLAAELGYVETPLSGAMATQLATRRPTNLMRTQTALGWHVAETARRETVGHGGATVGSASYVGFDRQRRCGVVVLTNMREAGDESIGWTLLNTGRSTSPGPRGRPHKLDTESLERFVGRYRLFSGSVLDVTRNGERLLAQLILNGGAGRRPTREIIPLTATRFAWSAANVEVTFVGHAPVTGIVLHSAGGDRRGTRLVEPS